jgi:hypothetical protein
MVDNNILAHGRAQAGAKALHAVGHISKEEMDNNISKSKKAIEAAKAINGSEKKAK